MSSKTAVGAPGGTGPGGTEQSEQGLGYVGSRGWETPWGVQGWVKCDTPGCFLETRSFGLRSGALVLRKEIVEELCGMESEKGLGWRGP